MCSAMFELNATAVGDFKFRNGKRTTTLVQSSTRMSDGLKHTKHKKVGTVLSFRFKIGPNAGQESCFLYNWVVYKYSQGKSEVRRNRYQSKRHEKA
jgi:hypothetical protein